MPYVYICWEAIAIKELFSYDYMYLLIIKMPLSINPDNCKVLCCNSFSGGRGESSRMWSRALTFSLLLESVSLYKSVVMRQIKSKILLPLRLRIGLPTKQSQSSGNRLRFDSVFEVAKNTVPQ